MKSLIDSFENVENLSLFFVADRQRIERAVGSVPYGYAVKAESILFRVFLFCAGSLYWQIKQRAGRFSFQLETSETMKETKQ